MATLAPAATWPMGFIAREIERVDGADTAPMLSMQSSLVIHRRSMPMSRKASTGSIYPRSCAANGWAALAWPSPMRGQDPASMTTHAERVNNDYRLMGAKTWISNAPIR